METLGGGLLQVKSLKGLDKTLEIKCSTFFISLNEHVESLGCKGMHRAHGSFKSHAE